jgi:hypothetical protein
MRVQVMLSAAAVGFCALTNVASATFLVNGDFEAGNTGFSSDYTYVTASVSPYVGQYGVTTSAFAWTGFWTTPAGDQGTGTGKFFIADGGPNLAAALWRETVNVPSNTQMTLSGYLATWSSFTGTPVRVEVNGVSVGTWGTAPLGVWTQYSSSFNTGASTSITVALYATQYVQPGADVAIDSLVLVPAPGACALATIGALCLSRRRR